MNGYTENDYENDVEIDLVDLIFYFLKKWKTLIIAVIIGALIGGGFCAYRAMNSRNKAAVSETKAAKDYTIDDDALDNMAVAYGYRMEYERQKEYLENSVFMQLDPNAFYRGTLKYYISAGDDTHLIWMLYQDLINEYDFYEDLVTALGVDTEPSYMKELVSVAVNMGDPSIVHVDVFSGAEPAAEEAEEEAAEESSEEEAQEEPEETSAMAGGWAVTYTVLAEDEESCEKMLEVIRKKVQALDKSCEEEYPSYTGMQISKNVQPYSDSSYFGTQKTQIDQMNTDLSNAVKLEDAFSDEEKEYYEKVYWSGEEAEEAMDAGMLTAEDGSAEAAAASSSFKISKRSLAKWVIFGIIGGIMVWGCWYLIIYLMDSSVKTVGELRDSYRLPILGHVSVEGSGKRTWVDKLYAKVKGSPDTVPYIVSEIDTLGEGPIALCGDKEYNDVQAVMVELAENCDDVSANDFASKSIESLQKVKNAGAEILIVRLGKTRRAEIRRELEVCRMQNVKVAGIVAVEDA